MNGLLLFFISPTFVVFSIAFSSIVVSTILKGKIDKQTDHLIRTIIGLPAIPVFWLWMGSEPDSPKFFTFYLPLIVTLYFILMLVIGIIKYNKSRR